MNKSFGKDNKSTRASGILVTRFNYYPVYYLGNRNMRWNKETEQMFRDQFEQSELGHGMFYGGNILLGENWEMAEHIALHAANSRSRLIHFTAKDSFYYSALDDHGIVLLRAIMDQHYLYRLRRRLKERCGCPTAMLPDCLFKLESIVDIDPYAGKNWFFDFQMPVVQNLCNPNIQLVAMPGSMLDAFDAEGGDGNGAER